MMLVRAASADDQGPFGIYGVKEKYTPYVVAMV